MESKLERLRKFAEEQKSKSLEFYKSTKLDNFTGEVVAFELMLEEIKKIENEENEMSSEHKSV